MKKSKAWLALLFGCLLPLAWLTACGGDDENDEPEDKNDPVIVENPKKDLVGVWMNTVQSSNDNPRGVILFPDNKCWVRSNVSANLEECSWTYNKELGLLATTSEHNLQWKVTIADESRWSGVNLNGGVQTFKKDYEFFIEVFSCFKGYAWDYKLTNGIKYSCSMLPHTSIIGLPSQYQSYEYLRLNIRADDAEYKTKDGRSVNLLRINGIGNKAGVFKCTYYEWKGNEVTELGTGEFDYNPAEKTLKFTGVLDFDFRYAVF